MIASRTPPEWKPMLREAGIAAQSLCAGLTALRKANYAEASLYNHAFFCLSVGFERLMKITMLIERRAVGGDPPLNSEFKHYRHDLLLLFSHIEQLRENSKDELRDELPDRELAMAALSVLNDFAQKTRYYNLDVLTKNSTVQDRRDPIEAWAQDVGRRILETKYTARRAAQDERNAALVGAMIEDFSVVRHFAEDGSDIISVYDGALRTGQAEIVQREGVVICAALVRHIVHVLWIVNRMAMAAGARDVPHVYEFFGLFLNSDRLFRSKRRLQI